MSTQRLHNALQNSVDLNNCYKGHNFEQHSRSFNQSNTSDNFTAGIVTFKPYNSKGT